MALRQVDRNGELSPWVFPNSSLDGPVCNKSLNKQIADRQRGERLPMQRRSLITDSLLLSGGRWRPHDLRRTAATYMAQLGFSSDVIDECLNHKIQGRSTRIYIRDRREKEQAKAFEALGQHLSFLANGMNSKGKVTYLQFKKA